LGASTDLKDKHGFTALMLVSQYGHGELVDKLLGKSASIDLHC
jgi:ankyrin repeat protein